MRGFRTLEVWQKAHKLTLDTYAASAALVERREFDLRRQMVRAAVSVPANIAEGCGRTGDPELRRFCRIALGSASELEYHFLLARDLGLLPAPAYEALTGQVVEVKKMLTGFIARLKANSLKAES